MRKALLLVAILLLVLAGAWFILGGEAPRTSTDVRVAGVRANVETMVEREHERERERGEASRSEAVGTAKPRPRSKAERDALRAKIVQGMQARGRWTDARSDDAGTPEGHEPAAKPGRAVERPIPNPPDEAEPTPGNLIDRTGNHGHLRHALNHDLMPLVDECYALARETQPELTGMLVIDVEMIGDEDLGSVVETVTPGALNELPDEELIECVRESLLSTTLPPPPEGGRDAISLFLRLEPEEG